MTTKREKEESEPRVPVVVVCTPPQPIPAPLPMLMIKSSSLDSRTTSPVVKSDLGLLREVTRCSGSGCKKRVGLMRFRCRCGDVFRYSDRHHCTYDYKAAGRDNPLVRATKLLKV